jgi:hypothetical protein
MDSKKKEITISMKSQKEIMDAHSEHLGKWVVVKGFNDNEIVAYGSTHEQAAEDAISKGYKIVGHVDDPVPPNIMMYCFAPCESQVSYSTVVNMKMVESGCNACPICKHRKEE